MQAKLDQVFMILCEASNLLVELEKQARKSPPPDVRETHLINSKIDDVLYTMRICNNRIQRRLRQNS